MTIQTTNWHDKAKSVALPSRPFIDGAYVDARTSDTFDAPVSCQSTGSS